ncbi:hypothetical protein DFH11DRAFT_1692350 [Phellopilus nigrolimitatus]|nr:hypothetical protein DFH11DRAFT_1692350 [Phellopilus nigrolimitatus]
MSFDASAVPSDIWFEIASFTGFKEVLSLEATCKFFREVVLNRLFWIERLRALEQDRAPDLPPHVSIDDLTLEQLRTLVVRAHRRVLNYTGPAPMRPTRETTVRVGFVNSDGTAGRPLGYMLKMKLLPGGVLLLVLWSEGDLQCWTVPGGKCVWSYRWQPEAEDMPPMKVCSFAYDMQANGDVRVLVVSESTDSNVFER